MLNIRFKALYNPLFNSQARFLLFQTVFKTLFLHKSPLYFLNRHGVPLKWMQQNYDH